MCEHEGACVGVLRCLKKIISFCPPPIVKGSKIVETKDKKLRSKKNFPAHFTVIGRSSSEVILIGQKMRLLASGLKFNKTLRLVKKVLFVVLNKPVTSRGRFNHHSCGEA